MHHRFHYMQLDVFSSRLFEGNPLAVVLDADALDGGTMQRIARWTNLSETAFLLKPTQPQADYRVRIFTPRQELPFAGHPSVGSAYVAIEAGKVAAGSRRLVQECMAGLLPVSVDGDGPARILHVQSPPATIHVLGQALTDGLATALRMAASPRDMRRVNNGPTWIVCDLGEAAAVRALTPDYSAIAALGAQASAIGVCVFGRERDGAAAMAVRAFCPGDGIPEDPVTGSANAAIAAYLRESGGLAAYGNRYLASQGREVGRDGMVHVHVDTASPAITIGGACAIGARGELQLDEPASIGLP